MTGVQTCALPICVVEFDGQPITDSQSFRLRVLYATSPTTVQVEREGQDEPVTLDIVLPGQPIRIGISWRLDEAEPETAIVTRVMQGSVGQIAGMRIGDRIYSVAGKDVETSATLLERLKHQPAPFRVTVEREGQLSQLTFDAPPPLP